MIDSNYSIEASTFCQKWYKRYLSRISWRTDLHVLTDFTANAKSWTAKALGLGLGADDYITKPFSVVEVLARQLGGDILLESTPHVKTVFTLRLRNSLPIDWAGGKTAGSAKQAPRHPPCRRISACKKITPAGRLCAARKTPSWQFPDSGGRTDPHLWHTCQSRGLIPDAGTAWCSGDCPRQKSANTGICRPHTGQRKKHAGCFHQSFCAPDPYHTYRSPGFCFYHRLL